MDKAFKNIDRALSKNATLNMAICIFLIVYLAFDIKDYIPGFLNNELVRLVVIVVAVYLILRCNMNKISASSHACTAGILLLLAAVLHNRSEGFLGRRGQQCLLRWKGKYYRGYKDWWGSCRLGGGKEGFTNGDDDRQMVEDGDNPDENKQMVEVTPAEIKQMVGDGDNPDENKQMVEVNSAEIKQMVGDNLDEIPINLPNDGSSGATYKEKEDTSKKYLVDVAQAQQTVGGGAQQQVVGIQEGEYASL